MQTKIEAIGPLRIAILLMLCAIFFVSFSAFVFTKVLVFIGIGIAWVALIFLCLHKETRPLIKLWIAMLAMWLLATILAVSTFS